MTKRQQKASAPTDELQGVDRVVALLLAMDKPSAHRIIKQFEDREIRALARSAAVLPVVELDKVEKLIDELYREMDTAQVIVGSSQEVQGLLSGVIDDEDVNEIVGEINGEAPKKIWRKLVDVPDERLAKFLVGEQPQVAAFVLSKLPVEKVSAVMEKFDADLRADLSSRLLSLKPISDAAARLVADRLAQDLLGEVKADSAPDHHARLGAILNRLDRQQAAEILGRLETSHPHDVPKVRRYIFGFEDIIGLTPEDRALLLDQVPAEQLVLALRGAGDAVRAAAVSALSPRSQRLVEAELANNIKVPPKSVLEARRAISDLALTMAEKATIRLSAEEEPSAGDPATP
jgi:flagellar motor switch protein FliG